MLSFHITEVKPFMAKLLTNSTFDHFILKEMEIQTFMNIHVSGQFNEAFYNAEELEERGDKRFISWSEIRGTAFSVIKGSKTPQSFKIIFQLPPRNTDELIRGLAGKLKAEDVGGLYINIRFEKGELHIITGTAIKTFTLDKTLEQVWDMNVRDILEQQEISFEEE